MRRTAWSGLRLFRTSWPVARSRDPLEELLDDLEVDVGLEQGEADLAQGGVDVGLGEGPLAAQRPKDPLELVAQSFEQPTSPRSRKTERSPRGDRARRRTQSNGDVTARRPLVKPKGRRARGLRAVRTSWRSPAGWPSSAFVSRRRPARVRPKAQRNLAARAGRLRIRLSTSPWGIERISQSVWAMAWAEAGPPSKNSTSPKKSPGRQDGEGLLADPGHHLADPDLALGDHVKRPPDSPSVRIWVPSG